ncbi:MAG: sulfurtransferase-like selenium metabolism protein YedF [Coprococcus sp.]
MLKVVNAMGDACPIPVVKTKNAIKELIGAGMVETLVDNEIAVQNLTKMAQQKNYGVRSEKLGENQYRVIMTIGESANEAGAEAVEEETTAEEICMPDGRKGNKVVVISSSYMGTGDDELGAVLMKGFIYALSQQDELPKTILFYNSGAKLACEMSPTLEDLMSLEANGVEILTCGTCLNHYGLTEKLKVGGVTNMYVITEKMMQADLIVKP